MTQLGYKDIKSTQMFPNKFVSTVNITLIPNLHVYINKLENCLWFLFVEFVIVRKPEFGGNKIYLKYEELEADFAKQVCQPAHL